MGSTLKKCFLVVLCIESVAFFICCIVSPLSCFYFFDGIIICLCLFRIIKYVDDSVNGLSLYNTSEHKDYKKRIEESEKKIKILEKELKELKDQLKK